MVLDTWATMVLHSVLLPTPEGPETTNNRPFRSMMFYAEKQEKNNRLPLVQERYGCLFHILHLLANLFQFPFQLNDRLRNFRIIAF